MLSIRPEIELSSKNLSTVSQAVYLETSLYKTNKTFLTLEKIADLCEHSERNSIGEKLSGFTVEFNRSA